MDWTVLLGTFVSQFVLVCIFSMTGALIPAPTFRIAVDLARPGVRHPGVVGLMLQMQHSGNFLGPILWAWLATQAQDRLPRNGWGSPFGRDKPRGITDANLMRTYSFKESSAVKVAIFTTDTREAEEDLGLSTAPITSVGAEPTIKALQHTSAKIAPQAD